MRPLLDHGHGSPQSVLEVSTVKYHMIGTPAYLPGGRRYYYARSTGSSALTRGHLQRNPALAANHMNLATTTTCMTVGSNVVTGVTLGATDATKNMYEDGFMAITAGAGQGTTYRIREHALIAGSAVGSFTLYDPIAVVSDASTTVSLLKDPFADVVINPTSQACIPMGVPNVAVPAGDVTTQYFWLQTWGPCVVWVDGTPAVGATLSSSTATAGQVMAVTTTLVRVGEMLTVGVNNSTQTAFLRLH